MTIPLAVQTAWFSRPRVGFQAALTSHVHRQKGSDSSASASSRVRKRASCYHEADRPQPANRMNHGVKGTEQLHGVKVSEQLPEEVPSQHSQRAGLHGLGHAHPRQTKVALGSWASQVGLGSQAFHTRFALGSWVSQEGLGSQSFHAKDAWDSWASQAGSGSQSFHPYVAAATLCRGDAATQEAVRYSAPVRRLT